MAKDTEDAELRQTNDVLRRQNQELLARIEEQELRLEKLESAQTGSSAFPGHPKTLYELQADRLKDNEVKRLHLAEQSQAILLDGPVRFRVRLVDERTDKPEPGMERIVGAPDAIVAEAKYRSFMGMKSTVHRIEVVEESKVKSADSPTLATAK